jgi:hypothetical protein
MAKTKHQKVKALKIYEYQISKHINNTMIVEVHTTPEKKKINLIGVASFHRKSLQVLHSLLKRKNEVI